MGDLISRASLRNAMKREKVTLANCLQYIRAEAVMAKIDMAPSVDAVPVVRCRECKYLLASKLCSNPMACGWDALEPNDDDFCSRGVKLDAKDMDVPTIERDKICPTNGAPCNECVPGSHCAKMDGGAE